MRRYLVEAIGTFFLVLTIVTSVRTSPALAPIAIGGVLAALVFAGGHVSGAHYNPAVTVAVWLRGRVETRDVPGYLVAQAVGAVGAGAVGNAIVATPHGAPLTFSGHNLVSALVAEALVTFALAYVVLNVATSDDHAGNSFYGLAIGLTVLGGAVAVGGISGGVFNPAVALGISTAGLVSWSTVWVYLTADVAGAVLAAVAFRFTENGRTATAPAAPESGDDRVPAQREATPRRAGAPRSTSAGR